MTAPSLVVEFAPGFTWQTEPAAITWVDITDQVMQAHRIRTRRGASSARGQVDVGSLDLSLKNADRRFDPLHATGPYFGDLKPGVPIRVRAVESLLWDGDELTWDGEALVWGGDLSVWYGTVAKWPQRYDIGNTFGWVPVECWDGFDKLSRAKIPRSVIAAEILTDSPVGYWPLDETTGQVMVDHSGNGNDGAYTHGSTGLSREVESDDGFPIRGIAFDDEHRGKAPHEPFNNGDVYLEAVVDFDSFDWDALTPLTQYTIVIMSDGNSAGNFAQMQVSYQGDGETKIGFWHHTLAGGTKSSNTNAIPTRGVHHIVVSDDLANPIYVDGAGAAAATSFPSAVFSVAAGMWVAGPPALGAAEGVFAGVTANAAAYTTALSAARIAAHSSAALAPLDEQTTDQRFGYVLDEIDWPTNLRDLETGNTTLGPATFKPGDAALDYFRLISATEDGLMFFTTDGKFRFLNRYWRYQATVATVSQFTFTDQDGDQGYAEFQLDTDDELLVNIARYTRRDGVEQVASDATSVATYGEAEKQQSNLLNRTDNEVRGLAQWAVATQSEPQPRVPKIRIPLHRYSNTDQQTVLGLDLGHRVTVLRTPQGVGTGIDLDFVVDGISHDIGEGEWWTDLYVSPAPDSTVTLFTLGTSQLGGTHILAH